MRACHQTRKAILFCIPLSCISIAASIGCSAEYVIPRDFDLIHENKTLHTIRIYALVDKSTNIKIASEGQADAEERLTQIGSYKDFSLPVGTVISADQPVAVISYDSAAYSWEPTYAGTKINFDLTGKQFYLAAAAQDATELSVDMDHDGKPERLNLDAGHASMGWVDGTLTFSSSKPVSVFTFTTDSEDFKYAFLLNPGSNAYTPLNTVLPSTPKNDEGTGGNPQAEINKENKSDFLSGIDSTVKDIMHWLVDAFSPADAHAAASSENTVHNGDGTFTFTQRVDEGSSAPHYTTPSHGGGFEIYSWYNQDYGWKHTFPNFNQPGIQIQSVTLTIRAWDVDAETSHGYDGEYDGITGDGSWLNPQYLQGNNGTWAVTNFNVDPSALIDGSLDVWCDIDMHHNTEAWATTLDYSELTVNYAYTTNKPPYSPTLAVAPVGCTYTTDDLVVNVTGPTPADPEGDSVTYEYRWLVDVGTGNYIDDEFANRGNHTGNTVLAADTQNNDKWKVEVTPIDAQGARGTKNSVSFAAIGQCNTPPVADAGSDQTVGVKTACTLNGSGSSDPDGSIVSYKWELYAGGSWSTIGTSQLQSYTFAAAGTYTLRLTVTDNHGAVDDDLTYITVKENQLPVAVCQDITVQLDANGNASIAASDIDGGSSDPDGNPITLNVSRTTFDCSAVGANPVMLTVTDDQGASSSCQAAVTVQDKTAPVVKPKNITVQLDASGEASIAVPDVDNGSTDNCCIASRSISKSSFTCADVGQQAVTLTVTDCNGNSSSATANVTVQDKVAPTVKTKNVTVQLDAEGKAAIVGSDVDGGSTDNCCIASRSISKSSFTCADVGQQAVTLTVTDCNGNSSSATANVTVQDKVAPVIKTKNITVQLDASGKTSIIASDVDNGSADNCCIASRSLSKSSFTCADVGQQAVTLTVTDCNGNSSSATATVTVADTLAPTNVQANAQATITPPDAPISFKATATDNCSASVRIIDYFCYKVKKDGSQQSKMESCVVNVSDDTLTIANSGGVGDNIVWTVLATDQSGNTATAKGSVLVANPGNAGGKGNNGVGNGQDPQPPGNPPVNDGAGTSPGNPGNKKK